MNRQKPYTLYAMLVLAALWIVFFLCAPYIAPFDPETTSIADRLQDISSTHLLGTDQLGRDVWSRILYGGKASLGIAFTIIGISGAIGIAIGGLAGFSTRHCFHWYHGAEHYECHHFPVHYEMGGICPYHERPRTD